MTVKRQVATPPDGSVDPESLFGRGRLVFDGQPTNGPVSAAAVFHHKPFSDSSTNAVIDLDLDGVGGRLRGQPAARIEKGCERQPCRNGAECFSDSKSSRAYMCRCRNGFYGLLCEYGLVSLVVT
jgi:hypothetical protein